ncbi:MAG: aminotransferase class I/II-fold pyridoxal phosphate-dependent enzyme [Acidobacteria bacterium]|nr:aminotransferase class I/II-fold pyridoxal phosphate-dependent enzyme [Acidobacteriota bacterium]MBU4253364.1 aminotransferase class I/II-fold pyridoxal phosphate-dependent enzyme [Acidobacteriota bacterium]
MKIEPFSMERMQSTWENVVEYDMSESGIRAVTLRELKEMGFDLDGVLDMPLGYSQSNGTIELRREIAGHYPGSNISQIEVTNGTSEANYIVSLVLLQKGDGVALELPNYMQLYGVPRSLEAVIRPFHLRYDREWEPDWEEFERSVTPDTRMVYVSNPNNPTGAVLSADAMKRIVDRCEETGAWLLADEVYIGAEIDRPRTPSFWGMSDRVIVCSGLSKAYGIPGIRIGWIVGPEDFIEECWSQHDYLTIGPNKLSDRMARTAVRNRQRLYERTGVILRRNYPLMEDWIRSFDGLFTFHPPQAGAFVFLKYESDTPSESICESIRRNQSTLIVPGLHLGCEGFLRIWMGAEETYLEEGLERIKKGLLVDGRTGRE